MPLHPIEREYVDRRAEAMAYIAQKLGEMDEEMATRADFGEFVRTIFIGMDRTLGFPKLEPAGPCPEFQRADAKAEAPRPKEDAQPSPSQARDLKGYEHRDGEVHMATEAQVKGIFRWVDRDPRYEGVMRRYLEDRNLIEPGQLTKAEASDLMDEFARKAGLRPSQPQGARA